MVFIYFTNSSNKLIQQIMIEFLLCVPPGARCEVRVMSKTGLVLPNAQIPSPPLGEVSFLLSWKGGCLFTNVCIFKRKALQNGHTCRSSTSKASGSQREDGRIYSYLFLPSHTPLQPGTPSSPSSAFKTPPETL